MKKLIVLIFTIAIIYSFTTLTSTQAKELMINPPQNILAQYSEQIYSREKCNNCHTLISSKNSDAISLDGMGGYYKNFWHYSHLENPQLMVPESKMPSFSHLITKIFTKEDFIGYLNTKKENNTETSIDLLWKEMCAQADSIRRELKKNDIDSKKNAEIVALIAYLQSIPSSPYKIKQDSIEHMIINKKHHEWNDLINDDKSIIYKLASSKDKPTINNGLNLYKTNCIMCHGPNGGGMIGPNLTDEYWLYGGSLTAIAKTIANGGEDGKGMIAWENSLTPKEVGELVAYIASLKNTNPKNAKEKQGSKE